MLMVAWDWNTIIVVVCALLFIGETVRMRQFFWLSFALFLWLYGGWVSAKILPNILGITQLSNIYLLHFYAFIGSIFFWLNDVIRQPESGIRSIWQSQSSPLLTLFALANLVAHAAFILLAGLIWWEYPNGLTTRIAPILLQLYAWQPLAWWTIIVLLMLIFALHRYANKEAVTRFTLRQLQGGLLIAVLMQITYIVMDLYRLVHLMKH
ncbi:hypothetical protein MIS45_06930 [Wielerella bovis]|uniref:hypothetical protein n=1 Tax=Wielerella bovis TaxID=2917790 RepID=UPI0020199533|nr:hypothetical protein [Wielerella bovis]ULJ68537.1 hypothetical protein MIS45_06930 [Wielerella bovis]